MMAVISCACKLTDLVWQGLELAIIIPVAGSLSVFLTFLLAKADLDQAQASRKITHPS